MRGSNPRGCSIANGNIQLSECAARGHGPDAFHAIAAHAHDPVIEIDGGIAMAGNEPPATDTLRH